MTSSARFGSAIRPLVTAKRSWLKRSPSTLPTSTTLLSKLRDSTFPAFTRDALSAHVTLDVHDLRVPAHGVHELLHVVRLPHAGAAAGGFDHEVRGVRRGQEGRERRRGAAGRRQRPQRDATHEPDEEDEHCVAPPLPSPAGDGSVPERGEGRRARRGVRRGSGRDHPGGRGGGRALHGSSVPDLHRRANEVSRGMHLVVARVPTGRLPAEAGPSGSRGRWQRFEGLYRHPAGALRLVVRLQLAL